MRLALVALVALVLAGCTRPIPTPDSGLTDSVAATGPWCVSYSPARRVGSNSADLPELSGLVASRAHAGIFWAHNDSGNTLELFAVREDGSVAAKIPLTGATNRDVEDIALAPCGDKTCILLADIGDNAKVRPEVALHRLVEPASLTNEARSVESLVFTYTDGPHNAESLVVDPNDGTPYVITKDAGTLGDVYKVTGLAPATKGTATKIASVNARNNADQVSTAADAHPSGKRLLIRTYSHLWELRQEAGSFEQLFSVTPVEVPSASQIQSEAVAYNADRRGYVFGTEGVGEPLFRVDCRE